MVPRVQVDLTDLVVQMDLLVQAFLENLVILADQEDLVALEALVGLGVLGDPMDQVLQKDLEILVVSILVDKDSWIVDSILYLFPFNISIV